SSLVIAVPALVLFFLAYKFYAGKLERLWHIDKDRQTPAFSRYDKIDYVPAKNWLVLFGHHFSSIAGAGPIIGPVIAVALWGWLPALLWVVIGTIFIGGTHDYGSLITSIREGGSSVADIAHHAISRRAKILFSLFVWLALILVIAVFAYLCAETFVKEPKIVAPSLGLIPVAMLVGYLLYHLRVNSAIATALGLALFLGLIFFGNSFTIKSSMAVWLAVLFIYSYFASIMPVNILLQPRDYLSSFLLFFGVGAGYAGLLISRPVINTPYFYQWSSAGGNLWPALFVTVACGAVSGFHSLIASGTSSKQIASEGHVKRVGYGGMVAEGVVAVLAIIAATTLFGQGGASRGASPIEIFGKGFGLLTNGILGGYGGFIAITILNAFILTTLDTATRISRYLTEELTGIKNRYLSTLLIVIISAGLAFSGKWNKIWPAFGASNQLVAALALFVLSCWLLSRNKSVKFTFPPAVFMLVTTIAALAAQAVTYFKSGDFLLFGVDVCLISLAGFMVVEVTRAILIRRKKHA
ncbi:MAG: carbon starvation protein A, partial [Candidatus Omnitrophica bacterium]|nr:carbon starvation protein A [Candidatus Omnitrophota bacterium]